MLVGSRGILKAFGETRKPLSFDTDYDYLIHKDSDDLYYREQVPEGAKVEILKIDLEPLVIFLRIGYKAFMFNLKLSHLMWDIGWEKHAADVMWMFHKGFWQIDMKAYKELNDAWKNKHGNKIVSNLDNTAETFFNNAIDCPIPHEDLHRMLNPTPMYTKVIGSNEVLPEEKLFNRLSEEEKIRLITEEVMVMAYERCYKSKHTDVQIPYRKMLGKFITKHAPVYVAEYAILHLPMLWVAPFNFKSFFNNKH